jgi:hypothetical protein
MRPILLPLTALALLTALPSGAETIGGNPGPQYNYVCPHADGQGPLSCYFDAVMHLYTMCRNVKAIEILEFGYEQSTDGTNAAKSEYCLDKQKQNIGHPFKAALHAAAISRQAAEALQSLQKMWTLAMEHLAWRAGESDAQYKSRVSQPYEEFGDRIADIRSIVATANIRAAPAHPVAGHKKAVVRRIKANSN